MSIGESIKRLRMKNGIKKCELADKIGVAPNTIHYWELGRNDPTIFNCIAIADYFGVTLDELCRGDS